MTDVSSDVQAKVANFGFFRLPLGSSSEKKEEKMCEYNTKSTYLYLI